MLHLMESKMSPDEIGLSWGTLLGSERMACSEGSYLNVGDPGRPSWGSIGGQA